MPKTKSMRKIILSVTLLMVGISFMEVQASKEPVPTVTDPTPTVVENIVLDEFDACTGNTTFNIGQGIYDVTGPSAELGMMGHAELSQTTEGIHMRLRARTFVIESPCNGRRLVYVTADLGMAFQSLKQGVMKKLKSTYGDVYRDENVILSVTHTHAGPGGYSHYFLYNATTLGHDADNYNAIVNGIVASISQAHGNMKSGSIKLGTGELTDASFNRSADAYNLNPASERNKYSDDTDNTMTLLRFTTDAGREIGLLNWFALHPTNLSAAMKYISGDNKGWAAYMFEKIMGTSYLSNDTFVAAFAQSNHGDTSPNIFGVPDGSSQELDNAELIAERQYLKALSIYSGANNKLTGGVTFRHTHFNMELRDVDSDFTGGQSGQKTCKAAMGASFAAGSTEDQSGPFGSEGLIFGVNWANFTLMPEAQDCHQEKPILLPVGYFSPIPWTPEVIPVQVAIIGNLGLVAVPAECSTMCGRRLRETAMEALAPKGVTQVVIAGMANAYVSYMTTREEYSAQHYEGASTQFGPWTLALFQEQVRTLSESLRDGNTVEPGPDPRDLSGNQADLTPGVIFDDKPLFGSFGDVLSNASSSYNKGDTAKTVFQGGHPRNNLLIQSSYLEVQQKISGSWVTIAYDWDPTTRYHWKRDGIANSKVTITWEIPANQTSGTYRLKHRGHWKSGWTGSISSYSGKSREFTVN